MSRIAVIIGILLGGLVLVVGLHLLVIEVGREVVTLRTQSEDGSWKATRLWAVDYDGDVWLHSVGPEWQKRFEANRTVELVRSGKTDRYVATPDRSRHAQIDALLREKYGVADRWVRFLAPCGDHVLPVRLQKADS